MSTRRSLIILSTMVLLVWLMVAGRSAQAAETAASAAVTGNELFTVRINDGFQQIDVPVYEVSASTDPTAAAGVIKAAQAKVSVNPAGKTVTASIAYETAYFTQNYRKAKVTAKVSPKAGRTKKLTIKVTNQYGKTARYVMRVYRPAKPAVSGITLSAKTMKIRRAFKAQFAVASDVPVSLSVQVSDKNGDVIYTHDAGTSETQNPTFTWYWSGMRDDDTFITKGTYKLTAIVRYTYGARTKTVKKSVKFKAKNDSTATTASAAATTQTDSVLSDFTKTWTWTMMVTGDNTVDYLCELICQQVLTANMTQTQRAKALYNYCATHFTSSRSNSQSGAASLPEKIDVSSATAKARIAAYGKVVKQKISSGSAVVKTSGKMSFSAGNTTVALSKWSGDCTNFARMYQVLCRHAGLDADFIHNSLNPSTDPLSHYWNVVQINGKWYECDPRMGYLRGEGYVHFARGTTFMETYNAAERNYNDDVRRYSNIDPKYQDIYAKLSKTDCPDR